MDANLLRAGEARLVDWTEAEYFADRSALTRSVLGLLPDDPLKVGAWLRGETDNHATDEMSLGTKLHAAILEPDRFLARLLPTPTRPDGADAKAAAGSPGRIAFEAWERACRVHKETLRLHPGAIVISECEMKRIMGMIDAIRRHEVAAAILGAAGGLAEQTILWREPSTGLLVKVRVDWMATLTAADVFGTRMQPGLYVNDPKTTADDRPYPFVRSCKRFNYLTQAAMYLDAVEAAAGQSATWAWTTVTSDPCLDGKHGVSVYFLSDEQRERGRALYQAQARDALDRITRDDWTPAHRRGFSFLPM